MMLFGFNLNFTFYEKKFIKIVRVIDLIWFCVEIIILWKECIESSKFVGLFEIYWGKDKMILISDDYSFNLDIIIIILIRYIDCEFIVGRVIIFHIELSEFIYNDVIILFTAIILFFFNFFWRMFFFIFF